MEEKARQETSLKQVHRSSETSVSGLHYTTVRTPNHTEFVNIIQMNFKPKAIIADFIYLKDNVSRYMILKSPEIKLVKKVKVTQKEDYILN
jgi:hypothetical protein